MSSKKIPGILVISALFYPYIGGAEKHFQNLSRSLIEKGLCLIVLTRRLKGLSKFEVIENIPVHRKIITVPLGPFWGIMYMFSIFWFLLINLNKYQIIHCSQIDLHIPVVMFFKYFFRKKVVVRLSGASYYGDFERVKKLKGGFLILMASRWVDKVVAISGEIEKELIDHSFSKDKIIIIPNGVNVEYYSPRKKTEGQSLSNICFVGRLANGKGLDTLIDAFSKVSGQHNQTRLKLVGQGLKMSELRQQIERLGLCDHVDFVGEKEDVLTYYHQSDLLVLPSESEGMSNVLLEAMACELPIIATDIGANVELIGEKIEEVTGGEGSKYCICSNGILVPPRDANSLAEAIKMLLKDRALSERVAYSARRKVEEFYTLSHETERYMSLYSRL